MVLTGPVLFAEGQPTGRWCWFQVSISGGLLLPPLRPRDEAPARSHQHPEVAVAFPTHSSQQSRAVQEGVLKPNAAFSLFLKERHLLSLAQAAFYSPIWGGWLPPWREGWMWGLQKLSMFWFLSTAEVWRVWSQMFAWMLHLGINGYKPRHLLPHMMCCISK